MTVLERKSSTCMRVIGLFFGSRLKTDEDVPVGIWRSRYWKASIFICCSIHYTLSCWLCNADHRIQASREVLLLEWLTDRGITLLATLVHIVP